MFFKKYLLSLIIVIASLLLNSCGKVGWSLSTTIAPENLRSGIVSPLIGLLANDKQRSSLFSNKAFAASCLSDGNPVFAKLHLLNSDGSQATDPIATAELDSNARYSFDKEKLALIESSKVNYIVEVKGCAATYSRPITSLNDSQHVDARTSAIGMVIDSTMNKKMNEITGAEIDRAIALFGTTTNISTIFSEITSNTPTKAALENIFNDSSFSTKILDSAPKLLDVSVSESIAEATPTNFRVSAFHWNTNYQFGYEWRIGNIVVSTGADHFTYTALRNDQGLKNLSYRVGKNNGSGGVDVAFPYTDRSFQVTVQNTFKPITLEMSSAYTLNFIKNPLVDINLNTGASKIHCETFSSMAITVNTSALPIAGDFTYHCTDADNQTITNLYVGADEGIKSIRLWTMDDSGVITARRIANLYFKFRNI
jgi:hypothetical protein